jgi:citrate synthase
MSSLKEQLKNKIPIVQEEIKNVLKEKGDKKIGEVTVSQAYSGMRGIKAFVCDTSSVSADKGLIIRGKPLLDITDITPEEVFFFTFNRRLTNC